MATQREVIAAFMKSLDNTTLTGEAALDEAIKACSTFNSFAEVKAAMIQDIKNARSGDDLLKRFCGIDYDTDDTGAITGLDAGGSTSKDQYDVVPENGDLDTSFTDSSFTTRGLTVTLGDEKTFSDLTTTQQFIWQGLHTWWIPASLDLIAESYDDNYGFDDNSSATVKEISVTFYTEDSGTLAYTSYNYWTDSGETFKLGLAINLQHYDGLENNLDKATSEFGNTVAHELTHAVMFANIFGTVMNSLPGFLKEGLAEMTVGAEKFREWDIKNISTDAQAFEDGLDVTNTGTGEGFMYYGGYMFFRYLARQMGDVTISNSDDTLVTTFRGNDTVESSASNATISTSDGNDSITAYGTNISVDAGEGDNFIHFYADAYNVTNQSGTGNDTIETAAKVASIITDTGNDYVYQSRRKTPSFSYGDIRRTLTFKTNKCKIKI